MKKNANRQPRTRLQSIDAAQLGKVTGGCSYLPHQMIGASTDWAVGSGWREFFTAAGTV